MLPREEKRMQTTSRDALLLEIKITVELLEAHDLITREDAECLLAKVARRLEEKEAEEATS